MQNRSIIKNKDNACNQGHNWKLIDQMESGIKGEGRIKGRSVVYYDLINFYKCHDCGAIGKYISENEYKSIHDIKLYPYFSEYFFNEELYFIRELSEQEAKNASLGNPFDSTFLIKKYTKIEMRLVAQNSIVYYLFTLFIRYGLINEVGIVAKVLAWAWILLSMTISIRVSSVFIERLLSLDEIANAAEGDRETNKNWLTIVLALQFFWIIFPGIMAFWLYSLL